MSSSVIHDPQFETLMRRCLDLAARGGKSVRPNPAVGCVIVRDGEVVGEGWHTRFGAAHAETEALRAAGGRAARATLVVSLEPCNHHGKTPPCTDAIIDAGIREVIIGMRDPNSGVAGGGMQRLRAAGIRCHAGVLELACLKLNEVYLVNVLERRAFALLKVAQTLDGFIAPLRGSHRSDAQLRGMRCNWITGEQARAEGHALRAGAEAVLVGGGTLRIDNPSLTVRHVAGDNPRRIVLSASLALPQRSTVFTDEHTPLSMVITTAEAELRHPRIASALRKRGVRIRHCEQEHGRIPVSSVLRLLYEEEIWSVLVEGGAQVFTAFLEQDMVDRLHLFVAPTLFGRGLRPFATQIAFTPSGEFPLVLQESGIAGEDIQLTFRRRDLLHVHRHH
jgi:diaminohydroxyphosphoribosylaminopyrimidine deaminase / 5-amino-6-(5-phosphoribosylamino)uracil reductase